MHQEPKTLNSGSAGLVALAVVVAVVATPGARAAEATTWTLDSALKQIDKSTGDFRTAVSDVELTAVDAADAEPRTGSGKAYFSSDGSFRIDLSAPEEKTVLLSGSNLYVHDPARAIVERYPLAKHPERLEPYAALGFSLTGKSLSKDYLVGLLGEELVDDRKTLLFELTPKSDELRAKVSRVQVWIEEGSWMPLKQTVFHSGAAKHITVRYLHSSRNVPVDKALFKPKWPKGTQTLTR